MTLGPYDVSRIPRFALPDDPHPGVAEAEERMEAQADRERRARSAKAAALSKRIDNIRDRLIDEARYYRNYMMYEHAKALEDECALLNAISGEVHDL